MYKVRLKDVKALGTDELDERIKKWQEEHNTSGLPSAYSLGLEAIAYSCGTYGCNGHIYRDLKDGHLLGGTGYAIYLV